MIEAERRLFLLTALLNVGWAISDAYVVPYLWLHAIPNPVLLSFVALQFLAMALTFAAARRRAAPPASWMALGATALGLFLLGMVSLPQLMRPALWGAGMMVGVGFGLYWQGLYVAAVDLVAPDRRDRFNAALGAWETVAGLVGPPLGALVISWVAPPQGYAAAFLVSAILLLTTAWMALRLPDSRSHRVAEDLAFPSRFRPLLWAHGLRGAYEGIWMALPGLLLFEWTRSAWWVGVLSSLGAGVSWAGFAWVGKLSGPTSRRPMMGWASAAWVASTAALAWHAQPWVLFLWVMVTAFAQTWQKVPLEACTLDVVSLYPRASGSLTAQKEFWLNAGRMLGVAGAAALAGLRPGWSGLLLGLELTAPLTALAAVALARMAPPPPVVT
ncbi:MAG: MFS transporter [Firmicutes bacterium]|nr:MFS transporter [Bacillota bacterium]